MAAGVFSLYNAAKLKFLTGGTIDLDTRTIRAKLYKGQAAASVSAANALSLWSQIGTSNEAANVKTPTAKALTAVSVEKLNGSSTMKFMRVGNIVFTAWGGNIGSCQYVVFYVSASAGGGPVVGWNKLSGTAFDVTAGNTLTINVPANGWFVSY